MTDELKIDEDIARGLPGGVIDYPTHEAIEEALDRANAPMTEGGRFLTLVERMAALALLQRDMLAALKAADEALAQFTAFEDDARYIMGNTNFAIVKERREQVKALIAKASA